LHINSKKEIERKSVEKKKLRKNQRKINKQKERKMKDALVCMHVHAECMRLLNSDYW